MKVQNKKTPVATGQDMNDKDYLNSILSSLKDMAKNYTVMLTEASNEMLYEEYFKLYEEVLDMQRETFELAFLNGWYNLEAVESSKINTKYEMINTEYNDLFAE